MQNDNELLILGLQTAIGQREDEAQKLRGRLKKLEGEAATVRTQVVAIESETLEFRVRLADLGGEMTNGAARPESKKLRKAKKRQKRQLTDAQREAMRDRMNRQWTTGKMGKRKTAQPEVVV